jgi:hypothetical protein
MRLKAAKMSWEELKKNFDGMLQGFAFPTEPKKQGVDLGGSFDKFKDKLKEIIRTELKEITGTYGGDAMDATNEESDNIDESKLKKYYEYLLNIGGGDLGGEYEDILDKAKQFSSVEEFIEDDINILAMDDEQQANKIRQWVEQNIK